MAKDDIEADVTMTRAMRSTRAQERESGYAACRTLGHRWDVLNALLNGEGEILLLRCTRCAGRREDTVASDGVVTRRRYEMPKDYSEWETMSRAEWRVHFLSRLKPKEEGNGT